MSSSVTCAYGRSAKRIRGNQGSRGCPISPSCFAQRQAETEKAAKAAAWAAARDAALEAVATAAAQIESGLAPDGFPV